MSRLRIASKRELSSDLYVGIDHGPLLTDVGPPGRGQRRLYT